MQDRLDIFLCFVNEHHVSVRAYIRSLGAKRDWVDDLAQEAFVIAYQRLDDFDDQKELGNWVCGIAHKLLANKRRKEARVQQIMSGPLTDYLLRRHQHNYNIVKHLERNDVLAVMRRCIDKLPKNGRRLLLRRYQDHDNAVALADELNITCDALRQKLMRLRKSVKKCMGLQIGEDLG